jgi:hypothetical protein
MKLIDVNILVEEILLLLKKNKYLAAHELYSQLLQQIDEVKHLLNNPEAESSPIDNENEVADQSSKVGNNDLLAWLENAQSWLDTHQEQLQLMTDRMKDIDSCLNYQDHDEQWILGASHFGINTFYQLDDSDGSMIIKMEGHLELPLFEQCAVVYEVDLFHTWIPFCSDAECVDKIAPAELIA